MLTPLERAPDKRVSSRAAKNAAGMEGKGGVTAALLASVPPATLG